MAGDKLFYKKMKETIYKSMTEAVGQDANGNPMTKIATIRAKDPFKFEATIHYLAELGVFEGDWSKITKKVESNNTKSFFDKIPRQGSKSGKPLSKQGGGNNDSSGILDSIKRNF